MRITTSMLLEFPVIYFLKLADAVDGFGSVFTGFGLQWFDDKVFRDLVHARSTSYVEEYQAKMLTAPDWWYEHFCQGEITAADVQFFFDEFQRDFKVDIKAKKLEELWVCTYQDKQGYSDFKIMVPRYLLN